MPGTPPRAEARRASCVAVVRGHERGDGDEVVGVRGVPQPEQERDRQSDEQRRAVEETREPVVQVLRGFE